MREHLVALCLLAAVVSACSRPAGGAQSLVPGDPWAALPVDPSIAAVSRSSPPANAQAALDACGITASKPGHPGVMMAVGLDVVAGMGLVPHGFEAPKYAPLGDLAELRTDDPIWVINTVGDVSLPLGPTIRNAACIVYDGQWESPYWVGGDIVDAGVVTATEDPGHAPTRHLPPLAP